MKRFYCTICKRVKRVRRIPVSVTEIHSELPENRRGMCSYHRENAQPMESRMMRVGTKAGK